MKTYSNLLKSGLIILFVACISLVVNAKSSDSVDIKKVMDAQEAAWNNGDLEGFMNGYWKSDKLKFIGKNGVTYGWQNTYNRYKKGYPDKKAMGKLKFEIVSIESLGNKNFHAVGANPLKDETYMVVGKWETSQTKKAGKGYFTLIFKKINGSWVIVSDHTS